MAEDSDTSTSRGPAERKSGTSKPAVRRSRLGIPSSLRSAWMNSASARFRAIATRTSRPSANVQLGLRHLPVADAEGADLRLGPSHADDHVQRIGVEGQADVGL